MFSRVSQLARHLSRPLPNYAHTSAAGTFMTRIMTSSPADERNTRTIHTAACLIIGDEVLGGKVFLPWRPKLARHVANHRGRRSTYVTG
jgi:hypothetical protein